MNKLDNHSSISSCGLKSEEADFNENPQDNNKIVNIKRLKDKYNSQKNLAQEKFKFARNSFMGKGSKFYQIPNDYQKVGEFQYVKSEANQSLRSPNNQ